MAEVITFLGLGMRWRAEISMLVFWILDVFAKPFKLHGLAAQILLLGLSGYSFKLQRISA